MDWKSLWTGLLAMDWTRVLAIWGAMLSTALGGVQVFQWRERRRGKIIPIVRNFPGLDSECEPTTCEFVLFEAVNDAEKPVKITGLVLKVGNHEINLTPYSGTRNLTVISEGEDFHRSIARETLLDAIREKTKQAPPYKCVAVFHSRAGRRYKKRFTLDSQGVRV